MDHLWVGQMLLLKGVLKGKWEDFRNIDSC